MLTDVSSWSDVVPQLAQALPTAAPSDWVDMPIDARERLEAVGNADPAAVLLDPSTRWLADMMCTKIPEDAQDKPKEAPLQAAATGD